MNSSRISDSEQLLVELNKYLTIIPRARVGYDTLYPTNASGIILLLKTPPKYKKKLHVNQNQNKNTQNITHTLALFLEYGIMPKKAKPMQTLDLHYPVIQILIIWFIP